MLDNVGKPCHSIPGDSGCVLLGSVRLVVLAFNLTISMEVWGSDMLDNAGQPSVSMPGNSVRALLGSERVDESVLHLTSLLQGECHALKCLIM